MREEGRFAQGWIWRGLFVFWTRERRGLFLVGGCLSICGGVMGFGIGRGLMCFCAGGVCGEGRARGRHCL